MSKKKTQAVDNGTETAEAPKPAPPPAAPMASPFGDLDQVRQILFGAESQEIQQRFAAMQQHFTDVIDALKDSVDKRFKAMEASVKKQNDALSKRLNNEKDQRKQADADSSYVASLHAKGLEKILKKIGEEATETVIAAVEKNREQVVYETADLWFHTLVMLSHLDISHSEVLAELERRFGLSGLEEKAQRKS